MTDQQQPNGEKFGMARLHLFSQILELRPKERELREKIETAKSEKQKATFQKALANVQGWIEEFAEAYNVLGGAENIGVQPTTVTIEPHHHTGKTE